MELQIDLHQQIEGTILIVGHEHRYQAPAYRSATLYCGGVLRVTTRSEILTSASINALNIKDKYVNTRSTQS